MLKKAAGFVLAPFKASTYCRVRFGLSLAAASLDGLFEHLAGKHWLLAEHFKSRIEE